MRDAAQVGNSIFFKKMTNEFSLQVRSKNRQMLLFAKFPPQVGPKLIFANKIVTIFNICFRPTFCFAKLSLGKFNAISLISVMLEDVIFFVIRDY